MKVSQTSCGEWGLHSRARVRGGAERTCAHARGGGAWCCGGSLRTALSALPSRPPCAVQAPPKEGVLSLRVRDGQFWARGGRRWRPAPRRAARHGDGDLSLSNAPRAHPLGASCSPARPDGSRRLTGFRCPPPSDLEAFSGTGLSWKLRIPRWVSSPVRGCVHSALLTLAHEVHDGWREHRAGRCSNHAGRTSCNTESTTNPGETGDDRRKRNQKVHSFLKGLGAFGTYQGACFT